ncbi:amidohydrolase domain containing protein [Grosmannia clavigera kw1407]|uniref:Amidohydrolase domain containing protein n=1 Tax=Grosmannia clavigera (strain kw1407 / UAMH 11150) TaxID=655863 RepID=F0XKG3_GROCL|nr:amidohydrolase domain containing protein [Grosmannia clavigera kw1407]EFX01725.1 amidohydrolase domain containing protein [Grosmannia clavigera kw1407]
MDRRRASDGRDRQGKLLTLHTSALFDPKYGGFRENISVVVDAESGLIVEVYERDGDDTLQWLGEGDIDLRGLYVLPGLVDAHTHIFLHSYEEADALHQKRDESITERVVRGVNHCRAALLAGYTTYRDLGSEGMQDADTNLRDVIARGLMPGPRLFVATRELASTGSFELRTENAGGGHHVPPGPDVADGVEQCRQAVRRRIAAGADVVKVPRLTRSWPRPGMAQCPVAAHCGTRDGALIAITAGVTSIEHGTAITDDMLPTMAAEGIIFVPTLANAYDAGVRLACGGDTGTFSHGDNVRELELMIEAGVPVADVIESCTVGGWEACGGELCGRRFGWFEAGLQADISALDGDPE